MPNSQSNPTNGSGALTVAARIFRRMGTAIFEFGTSSAGFQAKLMAFGLLTLLLGISGLNVLNSYVASAFMSSIEGRDFEKFTKMALVYIGALGIITLVAVLYSFVEQRLGLLWRSWMTRQLLHNYMDDRVYQRLASGDLLQNPDQRIAEDVNTFTRTTISFSLLFLNASFTIIAFSGVLWSISSWLFVVAVAYAIFGSWMTVKLGKKLIGLNYTQFDKEANFRSQLVHIRENAESVAVLHRERRLKGRLIKSLDDIVGNMRHIIGVQRNLGFFTSGYNQMIQILPALLVAPLFINGQVEFGVITQSGIAFAHLMGAFSIIITQFQSISSYAAVISRLDNLGTATTQAREDSNFPINVCEEEGRVAYENLTLVSPEDGSLLLSKLNLEIPKGSRVLVCGKPGLAKLALFRATAGFWRNGEGRIIRPSFDDILFLPEHPYLPPGTLRELMLRTMHDETIPDEKVISVLKLLGLQRIFSKAKGLDTEQNWNEMLSVSEQQLLAIARLILAAPQFVFLDRLKTTLSTEQTEQVMKILADLACSLIALGRMDDDLGYYDGVLEIRPGGEWLYRQQCPLKDPSVAPIAI
jgi:putative ATP-binding cassette transporter